MLTVFWNMKESITTDSLEKSEQCQLLWQYFTFFLLLMTLIYTSHTAQQRLTLWFTEIICIFSINQSCPLQITTFSGLRFIYAPPGLKYTISVGIWFANLKLNTRQYRYAILCGNSQNSLDIQRMSIWRFTKEETMENHQGTRYNKIFCIPKAEI